MFLKSDKKSIFITENIVYSYWVGQYFIFIMRQFLIFLNYWGKRIRRLSHLILSYQFFFPCQMHIRAIIWSFLDIVLCLFLNFYVFGLFGPLHLLRFLRRRRDGFLLRLFYVIRLFDVFRQVLRALLFLSELALKFLIFSF